MIAVIEHLTEEQLRAYADGVLPRDERHRIGRHLLGCEKCLNAMPAPTPEQFLVSLFREDEEINKADAPEQTSILALIFNFADSLFGSPALIWSGAAILIVCFTLVGWWFAAKKSEVAVTPANPPAAEIAENKSEPNQQPNSREQTAPASPANEQNTNTVARESQTNQVAAQNAPRRVENVAAESAKNEAKNKRQRTNATVEANRNSRPTNGNATAPPKREAANVRTAPPDDEVAILRSETSEFTPTQNFGLIFPAAGQTVADTAPEFRWQSVPNAKSYQITIFDEKFKPVAVVTVSEARYKLDKPLEAGKTYLWRVAALLTDGEEIVAPRPPQAPLRFRIGK